MKQRLTLIRRRRFRWTQRPPPTHTCVYHADGYRFIDFMHVGIPLNLLPWLVASLVIPLFWPRV